MKGMFSRLGISLMFFVTALLFWVLLATPVCKASDMLVLTIIDNEPAIPTVIIDIVDYEGDFKEEIDGIVMFSCAEGTKEAMERQKREPMPGELDHIYIKCLKDSGVLF